MIFTRDSIPADLGFSRDSSCGSANLLIDGDRTPDRRVSYTVEPGDRPTEALDHDDLGTARGIVGWSILSGCLWIGGWWLF